MLQELVYEHTNKIRVQTHAKVQSITPSLPTSPQINSSSQPLNVSSDIYTVPQKQRNAYTVDGNNNNIIAEEIKKCPNAKELQHIGKRYGANDINPVSPLYAMPKSIASKGITQCSSVPKGYEIVKACYPTGNIQDQYQSPTEHKILDLTYGRVPKPCKPPTEMRPESPIYAVYDVTQSARCMKDEGCYTDVPDSQGASPLSVRNRCDIGNICRSLSQSGTLYQSGEYDVINLEGNLKPMEKRSLSSQEKRLTPGQDANIYSMISRP